MHLAKKVQDLYKKKFINFNAFPKDRISYYRAKTIKKLLTLLLSIIIRA